MNNVSNLDTIYELDSMRHTPLDGQDYETAAGLIKGNQFAAAAQFIDGLDTFPRDEIKFVIQKNEELYNTMSLIWRALDRGDSYLGRL